MEIITSPQAMLRHASQHRENKTRIALVPTMGALHEGHCSLITIAKEHADHIILSLFVNPLQFGANEDFETYPQTHTTDIAQAKTHGVDVIFMPNTHDLYPENHQTTVTVNRIENVLCGKSRPNHFSGVATIVAKLFQLTRPHVAVFGEKDYQQLVLIKRMVLDLHFPIEIKSGAIIRHDDGLAQSSRNTYLSTQERTIAPCIYQGLSAAQHQHQQGETDPHRLCTTVQQHLDKHPSIAIEYIEIRDAETLETVTALTKPAVLAVAIVLGKTRLIDNIVLK